MWCLRKENKTITDLMNHEQMNYLINIISRHEFEVKQLHLAISKLNQAIDKLEEKIEFNDIVKLNTP
jgi:hypothetical protein